MRFAELDLNPRKCVKCYPTGLLRSRASGWSRKSATSSIYNSWFRYFNIFGVLVDRAKVGFLGHDASPVCIPPRKLIVRATLSRDDMFNYRVLQVRNQANPGYSVMNLIHIQLHEVLPVDLETDLIIVDYGVNDAVLECFDLSTRNVELSHEILVRYVMNDMVHKPALLYAEAFLAPCKAIEQPWQASNMAEVHRSVTKRYDIPMVSLFFDRRGMRGR